MNRTEQLKKDLEAIWKIAIKNGWKVGKHVFNYLSEIEMHQYDTIDSQIIRLDERQKCKKELNSNLKFGKNLRDAYNNGKKKVKEEELEWLEDYEQVRDKRIVIRNRILSIKKELGNNNEKDT